MKNFNIYSLQACHPLINVYIFHSFDIGIYKSFCARWVGY